MNVDMDKLMDRLRGRLYREELIAVLERVSKDRSHRRCGSTHTLAVHTMMLAVKYPRTPVLIVDHHGTQEADEGMAREIFKIAESISGGVGEFQVRRAPFTVAYVPREGL